MIYSPFFAILSGCVSIVCYFFDKMQASFPGALRNYPKPQPKDKNKRYYNGRCNQNPVCRPFFHGQQVLAQSEEQYEDNGNSQGMVRKRATEIKC